MTITRNELVGKRVYNPDASLIGEITDIGFIVGSNQPNIIVRTPDGKLAELPWEMIGFAKDIILTKGVLDVSKFAKKVEVVQQQEIQAPEPGKKRFCPSCGKELAWIEQYRRWYCYKEKKYV